jgi:hypothetical protein
MTNDEQRIAEMESLFRDVNEHIAETAERFDVEAGTFYCECDDPSCGERVDVPLGEYEQVRSESTHFVLKPGHENNLVERIVASGDEYAVVRKNSGVAGTVAKKLDPRADPS